MELGIHVEIYKRGEIERLKTNMDLQNMIETLLPPPCQSVHAHMPDPFVSRNASCVPTCDDTFVRIAPVLEHLADLVLDVRSPFTASDD